MTDHDCPHAVTLRNLLDACDRGRPLADITDRLRVEVGRLDRATAAPTRPTREQVRQIIEGAYRRPMTTSEWMDAAAGEVLALIGGDDA